MIDKQHSYFYKLNQTQRINDTLLGRKSKEGPGVSPSQALKTNIEHPQNVSQWPSC